MSGGVTLTRCEPLSVRAELERSDRLLLPFEYTFELVVGDSALSTVRRSSRERRRWISQPRSLGRSRGRHLVCVRLLTCSCHDELNWFGKGEGEPAGPGWRRGMFGLISFSSSFTNNGLFGVDRPGGSRLCTGVSAQRLAGGSERPPDAAVNSRDQVRSRSAYSPP